MKKGLFKTLIFVFSFMLIGLFPLHKLDAASGTISVRSNRSQAVIGSTVTVTVSINSGNKLGSWEYTMSYDSSKLKLQSGTNPVVGYGNGSQTSASYTYTFKIIASGTSTVSVKSYRIVDFDSESNMSVSISGASIKGITEQDLEASYSKNNNLSSLGVTGYTLTPAFNKNTTEYSVDVPSDVEKVTLTAKTEDSTASVTGLGEKTVSEGENKFEITVTAENGSTKKYTVKVNVKDKNPIEVTVDGKSYTVVKRASTLTAPATYEEKTININGIEVPGFVSSITKFTLVGLKSTDGETALYKYDAKTNEYTLYKELKTNGITLFPVTPKEIPENYEKVQIKFNGEEIDAYKYKNTKDFYLIYGIDIETGDETFFEYDKINNTLSRYNDQILKELMTQNENYKLIIIVLGVETILLLLVVLITLTKKNKRKKRKNDLNHLFEEDTPKEEKKKEEPKQEKEKIKKEEKEIKNEEEKNQKLEEKDKK